MQSYGFGCNIVKPKNHFGRHFGYVETLSGVATTDSGVQLRGKDGSALANESQRKMEFDAPSYPSECFVTTRCKSCK